VSAVRAAALVPAYNEASTIGDVVRRLFDSVASVVVVDDGSTDGTGEIARLAGAEVVTHPANRGKGTAVRTGLAAILACDFTHVVLLDGDLQHLPHEAPRLLDAACATGADVIVGERRFDRRRMPASRYYANVLGSRALSSFMGVRVRDTQSGYRIFRTDILKRMRLRATGYDIETEMLVKLRRLGGRIEHVPVSAVYGGRSKLRPVRDTTRTCFLALYYRYIERF
jgi:glycosyltransferase involved in cell wall biosynthesis